MSKLQRPLVASPEITNNLQIIPSPTLKLEDLDPLLTNPANFLNRGKLGQRAGIIPYYLDPVTKQPIYLVGFAQGKYSDFGGGCTQRETIMDCALREYTEETRGVLDLGDGIVTHIYVTGKKRTHQVILMVYVSPIPSNINKIFRSIKPQSRAEREMERVELLSLQDLYSLFLSYKLSDSLTSVFKLISPKRLAL